MESPVEMFLLLLIFVHSASCEDFTTASVSMSSESESVNHSMPEDISVHVTIGGQDVRLQLKLDHNANTDIPVYVFSRNKDGELETKKVHRKKEKSFAVYRDVTHGAVFSGRRDVESGHGHLTLDGMLQLGNKVYNLKSAKRRDRNSTRPMADGKTGFPAHDVERRDVSSGEVPGNEAGDNHEFIVRLRDDLPPRSLRGDAISPPITEEEKKRKKKKIHYENAELHESPETVQLAAAPPSVSEQQSGTHLYIDVAAVTDYGVFFNWYANSSGITKEEKTQDVLDKLPEYYAFMFSGVNMLYEGINSSLLSYTLHIKLSAIIISTHRTNSPWTETWRVRASPRDRVDSHKALDSFFKWAATSDLLPTYDHLTLFSGYELFSEDQNSVINDGVLGVAYVGTMCDADGSSSSIIEDLSSFESVFVVAHELGHSLSAKHDGITNVCSPNDNNIMAANFYPPGASDRHNLWRFSSCSVNYFRNYISSTTTTARGHQCLYYSTELNASIPDVSGQQPGQVYDYDTQCRQMFGPQSRMCRGSDFIPSPSDICMKLYCDRLDDTCHKNVAARGTSCGNKKWCVHGDCVYDSRAPAMDENCPFGDLPGRVWFTNYTCAELIASDPSRCYSTTTFGRCCASCAKYYRPVHNCEYGDRVSGCLKSQCRYADPYHLYFCCGTCSYGTPITTNSTITTTTTTSPTIAATTTIPATTTTTTRRATTTAATSSLSTTTITTTSITTTPLPTTTTTTTMTTPTTTTTTTTPPTTTTTPPTTTTTTTMTTPTTTTTTTTPPTTTTTPPTTTTTTTMTTPTTTTTPPTTTTTATSTTERAPSVRSTTVNRLCVDTSDRVRGQTCADLVATSPDSCYDSHVILSCCASCNAHNTGVKGCEFGDRDPAQCRILIRRMVTCDEGRWGEECCHTCAYNLVDSTSAAVHSPNLATSVLAGWMWTIISLLKI